MKKLFFIGMLLVSSMTFGQEKIQIDESDYNNDQVEMADTLRADGKIYVVVGVILVILLSLVGYMVVVDKKIGKLEKQLNNHDANHDA